MNALKQHYTKALLELLSQTSTPEKVLEQFQKMLERKGHIKLYASVLRSVERELPSRMSTQTPEVVIAQPTDVKTLKQAIEHALTKLNAPSDVTIVEDKTIIGGFIASYKHHVYDASYKKKLTTLYRNIIR